MDPKTWLRMPEEQRLSLVTDFHANDKDGAAMDAGQMNMHCSIHVVVENQIAMNEPPNARQAIERLLEEGLSRHEAVHALGSVVSTQIWRTMREKKPADNDAMAREFDELTAATWLASGR